MKKIIYALILPLVVVSGFVFANREINTDTTKKLSPKPVAAAKPLTERQQWEATPAGIKYKEWVASPIGKKVFACADKIQTHIKDSSKMEAVITSLTLPPGTRLGFAVIASINAEEYILSFGADQPGNNEFEQLHKLKVNDKILIKTKSVSHAPKYSYAIVSGDYVEQNGKVIYKRVFSKDGC